MNKENKPKKLNWIGNPLTFDGNQPIWHIRFYNNIPLEKQVDIEKEFNTNKKLEGLLFFEWNNNQQLEIDSGDLEPWIIFKEGYKEFIKLVEVCINNIHSEFPILAVLFCENDLIELNNEELLECLKFQKTRGEKKIELLVKILSSPKTVKKSALLSSYILLGTKYQNILLNFIDNVSEIDKEIIGKTIKDKARELAFDFSKKTEPLLSWIQSLNHPFIKTSISYEIYMASCRNLKVIANSISNNLLDTNSKKSFLFKELVDEYSILKNAHAQLLVATIKYIHKEYQTALHHLEQALDILIKNIKSQSSSDIQLKNEVLALKHSIFKILGMEVKEQYISEIPVMKIANLQICATNIFIEGTIIALSETKTIHKKGKKIKYCNAVLEDASGKIDLLLWEENADKLSKGNRIRIEKGYVAKKYMTEEKELTLGKNGSLIVLE